MNITYRFENERNPAKEREFVKALIELARKHPEEEVNSIITEKKKVDAQGTTSTEKLT